MPKFRFPKKFIKPKVVKKGRMYPLNRVDESMKSLFRFRGLLSVKENLPDVGTRVGNIFKDRYNSSLYWYLPGFTLTDDPDEYFKFSAKQTGVDNEGEPFHVLNLQAGLKKLVPDDVVDFKKNHASVKMREIPIDQFVITLIISFKNADIGNDESRTFPGKAIQTDEGFFQLTFNNIMGNSVIILYENLTQSGRAQISIKAEYDIWKLKKDRMQLLAHMDVKTHNYGVIKLIKAGKPRIYRHIDLMKQSDSSYEKSTSYLRMNVPIENKYSTGGYQLKYTITHQSSTQPIININDLADFDNRQSEFIELKTLGDLRQKYPSVQKLYMGVLSKTIVVVPREYVIFRENDNLSANCLALLDSSPLGNNRCKFEFKFILTPSIGPIEFMQLSEEIANTPDLQGFSLTLPDTLNYTEPSTIITLFKSACQVSSSSIPHCFILTVEISDENKDSTAVGNANLFIKQLCLSKKPYISGTIHLKMDDYFEFPVVAAIVLNFQKNIGTEGVQYSIDESSERINLNNNSPFDFLIRRYAYFINDNLSIIPLDKTLKCDQTASISLPSEYTEAQFLFEYSTLLKQNISKAKIDPYMQFLTQDVQSTQYQLAVNVAGINFDGKNIEKIKVKIGIPALPEIDIPAFSLYDLHRFNSTSILIPIQYAISSLEATLGFTIHYKNSDKPNIQISKQNDFVNRPIFVLEDQDIPNS